MNFRGNILPHSWFGFIKYHNGKVNLNAIVVLSDIVYYYRPVEVEDEVTGKTIGYRKKFRADKLQRSYEYYVDNFGLTKNQARLAIDFLVDFGVITKEFRHFKQMSNVMFVEPVISKLIEITFTEQDHIEIEVDMGGDHVEVEVEMGRNESGDGIALECDTYTKSSSHESSYLEQQHGGQVPQTPSGVVSVDPDQIVIHKDAIGHYTLDRDSLVYLFDRNESALSPYRVDGTKGAKSLNLYWDDGLKVNRRDFCISNPKKGESLLVKNGTGYYPVIVGEPVEQSVTMSDNAKAIRDELEKGLGWESAIQTRKSKERYAELTMAAIRADEKGVMTPELVKEFFEVWVPKYAAWRGTWTLDAVSQEWGQFKRDKQNGYNRSTGNGGYGQDEVSRKFNSGEYQRINEERAKRDAHVTADDWQ
jgi:hypothetical protein